MAFAFAGQRALIYGAAKGIGQAVALEFARRGANVAVADIDIEAAEATAAQIRAVGREAVAVRCDVTDDADVARGGAAAEAALGEADIVMNNVGGIIGGDPQDIPLDEWRRLIDLNLMSVIRGQQAFLPKMLARGDGYLVNTASFAGLYPYAVSRLPYAASKAAVIALTEGLALYAEPRGVRVSCLCPGPVKTGIGANMKNWTPDGPMRGPGRQYQFVTPAECATILADGMERGRLIIPTDEQVWEDIRSHAASPDDFVRRKIAIEASGDFGLPEGFTPPGALPTHDGSP